MLPWEVIVGVSCLFAGFVLGGWVHMTSKEDELLERDALDRLSDGFEWTQDSYRLVFTLPDGDRIVFERGWSVGRWFRSN